MKRAVCFFLSLAVLLSSLPGAARSQAAVSVPVSGSRGTPLVAPVGGSLGSLGPTGLSTINLPTSVLPGVGTPALWTLPERPTLSGLQVHPAAAGIQTAVSRPLVSPKTPAFTQPSAAGISSRAPGKSASADLFERKAAPVAAILESMPAEKLAELPSEEGRVAGEVLADAMQGLGSAGLPTVSYGVAPGLETPTPSARALGMLDKGAAAATFGRNNPGPVPNPAPVAPPLVSRATFQVARFVVAPLVRLLYRLRVRGLENLPKDGPALIVPNHVAFVDAVLLGFALKKPVRFLIFRSIYDSKLMGWLFRAVRAIPIAPGEGKDAVAASLGAAKAALQAGETVVIFPEGQLTRTGNIGQFRRGFELIAQGAGAPVIPAHLDGLWGSVFSYDKSESRWARLKRISRPALIRFGKPLSTVSAQAAREAVQELGAASLEERVRSSETTLARAFLRTARSNWRALAAADSTGKELSFGETLTATVLLAGLLKSRLPEGRNVGILLPPSAGGVLANAALSTLGKTPVNLNYTAGKEAQAYAVEKAGIGVVLSSRRFIKKLEEKLGAKVELSAPMLYLEDLLPLVPKWKKALTYLGLRLLPRFLIEAVWFRSADRSLDDAAAILFTSGSSAMPKGVELTHLNLQSNLMMVRELFRFDRDDRVVGALPFFHSFGLTVTLWLPLLAGFGGVYHSNPLETGPIGELAAKYKATLLLGTPTFLSTYARKIPAEAFARLRLVIAGAEKLRPEIADAFEQKFKVRPLEGYGATELSPVASINVPDAKGQKGTVAGSVGQPMPGEAMKVVDPETGAPVPQGRPGMLLVKGANVMKGYLGEPAKTAEAVKDGWYVTGDIAVIDREGFVTLVGRLSRFSKLAGEMVSHVAVEERLQQAAGVSDQVFVVTGVPDPVRGERLVVLYSGWDGDIDALLAKAQASGLPRLWTPGKASFNKVDALPVLGTGKLDLRRVNELARELASK